MAIRKFQKRKKINFFAKNKIDYIDYKDVDLLKSFISQNGSIKPKRVTGTSPKHQRALSIAIKRARIMGLLPYVVK